MNFGQSSSIPLLMTLSLLLRFLLNLLFDRHIIIFQSSDCSFELHGAFLDKLLVGSHHHFCNFALTILLIWNCFLCHHIPAGRRNNALSLVFSERSLIAWHGGVWIPLICRTWQHLLIAARSWWLLCWFKRARHWWALFNHLAWFWFVFFAYECLVRCEHV